jgi:hypothetical protein
MASSTDARLAPFRVPAGLPETDVAQQLFANFAELYAVFTRANQEVAMRAQYKENKNRVNRVLDVGQIVFRRLPAPARLGKHLFPDPSAGPYAVVRQPTNTSFVLANPATGQLIENGANIPMDQVISGPSRAKLEFPPEEDSEQRPLSQMLSGVPGPESPVATRQALATGRNKGWSALTLGSVVVYQTKLNGPAARQLQVGRVIVNLRDEKMVTLQPYRGSWRQVRVEHKPLYQSPAGMTTEVGPQIAKETVRYSGLVSEVELLTGGELTAGSARRLSDRGWGLQVEEEEMLAFIREAGRLSLVSDGSIFATLDRTLCCLPTNVVTPAGESLEMIAKMSQGRLMEMTQYALHVLHFGERIAFLELFSGAMMLTLVVRSLGKKALYGWDALYKMGNHRWDFSDPEHQKDASQLVEELDPVIVHTACPCEKFSSMALKPGQKHYRQDLYDKAVCMVEFSVKVIENREASGGGGSLENPKHSQLWKLAKVVEFFGTRDEPKPNRYFATPDLCALA